MQDLDTIRLYEGLGALRFGASRDEAIALLGPDYTRESLEDGDIELTWPQLGLTLTFWGDYSLRLGYIDSERPSVQLNGVPLLGMTKKALERFVRESLEAEISDQGGNQLGNGQVQEWIDVDEYALMFWLLDGKLYRVSWSCMWEGEDEPRFAAG